MLVCQIINQHCTERVYMVQGLQSEVRQSARRFDWIVHGGEGFLAAKVSKILFFDFLRAKNLTVLTETLSIQATQYFMLFYGLTFLYVRDFCVYRVVYVWMYMLFSSHGSALEVFTFTLRALCLNGRSTCLCDCMHLVYGLSELHVCFSGLWSWSAVLSFCFFQSCYTYRWYNWHFFQRNFNLNANI